MSFAKWSDAKKKNQPAAKVVEDEESSTNSDEGKVPSFSEWSNKKKNKNQQTVTSTSEDKRPQTNTGTVPSFSEWSNRKRASLALQQWAQGVDDLAGDMQDYYEDWSGGSDIEGKSKIFDRRIESLNDTTRILGMQYGDVYGVRSFLDDTNPILSGNKDVVDQNLALFREQEAEKGNTQKELDDLKAQRTALEEKAKAEKEAQRQKELEQSNAKRSNDPLSSLNVGTTSKPKQNEASRNVAAAQPYNTGVGVYQKKEETYVPGGDSKPDNTGVYPSHSYQGATATTTELSDVDKQIKEIDRQIREKETRLQQLEQVERRQERGKRKAELEKISNNEDFDEYNGYQSTATDGFWADVTSDYSMGYGDLTYEYINNTAGVRDKVKALNVAYGFLNFPDMFGTIYEEFADNEHDISSKGYEYMKPEEVEIYNYLYRKEGKEKAEEYLDLLQETLNERKGGKIADDLEGKTLLQYGYGFYAGWDQFGEGIKNAVNFTDEYIPYSATQFASRDIREDLYNTGSDIMDGTSWGQVGYDLFNTTGNMLPSIALNYAAPGVGTAAMGVSAAGNAYQEMLNEGYTKEQARAYSTMVGLSEVFLEKLLNGVPQMGKSFMSENVLGNLAKLDNVFGKVAKSKGGQIIGSMISEGSEEGLQAVIEPMIKAAVTGEPVDIDTQEVWYSTLLGGFSGGMFQGVDILSQSGKKTAADIKTGKTIRNADGGVDALRKLANEMAGVSSEDMQKQIKKQTDRVDKKATNRRVGKLFDTVNTANNLNNASANQADIAKSLQRKGFTAEKANAVAEALVASYNGQNLTSAQQKLLESVKDNADVRNAIDTIMYNSESTMGQRSQNIRTFENDIRAGVISKKTGISMDEARNIVEGKVVKQEESLIENSYEVSADGKTIDKDGNLVSIQGVASIEDGRMVLQTEGGTVDAKDVIYGNRSEALVYEAVANLGDIIDTETANKLAEHLIKLGETTSEGYVQGIVEAYRCGYYGYSRDKMTGKKAMAATLTEKQRNVAYGRGEWYRDAQTKAEQAKKTAEKKGSSKKDDGVFFQNDKGEVVSYDESGVKTDAKRESGVQTAKVLKKLGLGGRFVFFESHKNADGKWVYTDTDGNVVKAPNGMYYKDGTVYVDLNAGKGGAGLTLFTLSHELTHFIQQWSPAKYKALADFLIREYEKTGMDVDTLVHAKQQDLSKKRGKEVSYDEAFHEMVADSMEKMFADGNLVQKLMKLKAQDSGLVNKIKGFVDKLARKIRWYYGSLNPDSVEGRMVGQMTDAIGEIQDKFAEALVEASENYQTAEKNTTEDGGGTMVSDKDTVADVKYSGRDSNSTPKITMSMTDSERTEILKGKVITAAVYEGQADKSIVAEEENLKSHEDKLIKSALVKIGEEFGVYTDYSITDVEIDIRLSKSNLKESVSKKINPIQIAKLLPVLRTAVENAVGVECHANRYFYDNDTVMFENLIGGYVEGEYFVPVRFGLKHSVTGKATLYLIVDQENIALKKIKAEVAKATAVQNDRPNTSRSAFKISIASAIPFVNGKDLLRYLPDDMLNSRQKEAKYEAIAETIIYTNDKNDRRYTDYIRTGKIASAKQMVQQAAKVAGYTNLFYHGSKNGGGFTRFRNWSYFTQNKQYAERYAQRDTPGSLYTVYVKMENAFDTRKADSRKLFNAIHDEYGLSDIQESGLPDWTDGYDIADYIEENNLDYDSIILDEGGDLVEGKPVSRGLSYVVRNSEQVKSADVITYDDDGNIIPISQRFNVENTDIRYSDRATESVSNRSLLANAFEGVVQNDIERKRLQEYKDKIGLINAEEQKLRKLNEQIKELSFAKGPRDTKAIRDLQDEAKKTANRINIYDTQLLRLEASKPLQNVLEREKKKAYQRAEKKGKEALDAYREKSIKTQREMLDRWQESRKKSVEGRHKTAMRHKIQNVVKELNDLLLNESKKRHVPDNLKKAVAAALDLVNMDTVGAEQRAAKYAELIAKETDQDKIDAYTVTMENILRKGEKMGQRLKELHDAYEEIAASDDPDIANAHDPMIAGAIRELSQTIGNTSIRDMTIEQLSDVYDMYKMVLTKVRDANKAMQDNIKENIGDLASRVVGEVRVTGGEHKYRAAILDYVRKFGWNNLKPVYAFERIGSATLTKVFNNVRAGEDVWAKNVTEARSYYLDKSKKYGYDSWDFKKKYRFESASGLEFELTLEQILSLYAYSKREQAHDHLRLGGFVFDSNIETYTEKGSKLVKYKVNTADAHQITPEILADITGKLTKEQMGFVDEMQDYLSTVMGAKGNEVTTKMYGVKLFKEKFYFPLKSAKQFMFEQNEVSGEVRIKNSGFTNKTVAKANNPVILSNFMDVWTGHVNDMSMYHAFTLPLEDFNRVFNYNSPKAEGRPAVSVKGTIQNAYSPAAVEYVKQLITDLNGGAMSDPRETFAKAMMSKFKKAKVMASLSVVIQQPSAIGRAFALVSPRFFQPTKDGMNHEQLWSELKKYAPVAVIKEMGYFDTNMGMSTKDFITAKEYASFKEKAKAIFTDGNFRDEQLSKLPALADELTWCAIWNAVKRETVSTHTDLRPGSEEFLKAAGERFTEVVTKTQVYDSVLARSANMRSKSGMMNMATSFMAEPTTTINMLEDAIYKAKRGNKGYAAKVFASVATSIVLNNALVALVYAMRDDDEDETYLEKYVESFVSGMLDDINPLTYYPFLKDAWSVLQGYDVERSDMSLISDLADSMKRLVKAYSSEDGDVAGAWWDLAGTVANIGGIPVQNIRREVKDAENFYNTLSLDLNGRKTTWGSMKDTLQKTVRNTLPVIGWLPGESKTDKLYDAIVSGDTAYVNRLKSGYDKESSYNIAVRKALRENDPRIHEAAVARNNGNIAEYTRIAKEIIGEGHFSQDDVVAAVNAEINAIDKGETTPAAQKASGLYKAEDFAVAISQDDSAMANAVKSDIIQTAQKNGKTEEEALKSFNSSAKSELKEMFLNGNLSEDQAVSALVSFCGDEREDAEERVAEWAFESEHGFVYGDCKEMFLEGEISASELKSVIMDVEGKTSDEAGTKIVSYCREAYEDDYFSRSEAASIMVTYGGMTRAEAEDKLRYIDVKKQFPDTYVDDAWVTEYYKEVQSSGITIETFVDYRNKVKGITGKDKKEKRMEVIDSLPISSAQKDALYLAEGWAKSTLKKAPWH